MNMRSASSTSLTSHLVVRSDCFCETVFAIVFSKWETSIWSNSVPSGFASDLDIARQKLQQAYGQSTLYWEVHEKLRKRVTYETKHHEQLGVASRQCSLSHSNFNKRVFGQSKHFLGSSASLFAWLGSLWLFRLPEVEKIIPRELILGQSKTFKRL